MSQSAYSALFSVMTSGIVLAAAAVAQPNLRVVAVTQLTQSGNACCATISSDGKQVGFNEGAKVILWDVANSTRRELPVLNVNGLSFSPDGSALYFSEGGSNPMFVRYSIAQGEVRRSSLHSQSAVSLSPDGKSAAFLRRDDPTHRSLIVAGTDLKNERRVVSWQLGSYFFHPPIWSPDGELIAVQSFASGGRQVRTVSVANGQMKVLASKPGPGDIGSMAWAAGVGGLFVNLYQPGTPTAHPSQIWHCAFPGGQWTQVTSETSGIQGPLSVSSDGMLLTAVRYGNNMNFWDGLLGMFGLDSERRYQQRSDVVLIRLGK